MLLMNLAADICTLRQDIAQKEVEFNQEVARVFKNLGEYKEEKNFLAILPEDFLEPDELIILAEIHNKAYRAEVKIALLTNNKDRVYSWLVWGDSLLPETHRLEIITYNKVLKLWSRVTTDVKGAINLSPDEDCLTVHMTDLEVVSQINSEQTLKLKTLTEGVEQHTYLTHPSIKLLAGDTYKRLQFNLVTLDMDWASAVLSKIVEGV